MKRVKKYILTGMLLILLAVLSGCGTQEPETGKKIAVYYVNTAETKVEVHDQYLNTKTPEGHVRSFLLRHDSGHSIPRPIACGNRVPP